MKWIMLIWLWTPETVGADVAFTATEAECRTRLEAVKAEEYADTPHAGNCHEIKEGVSIWWSVPRELNDGS